MPLNEQFGTDHRERNVAQRFEAKYLVSELQASAVRDFIDPYVTEDSHGFEYPVTSLYLDNPALSMYWSSEVGEKNRYKLRIRGYDDSPDSPVFFEVKRRMDQVILKRRATVHREYIHDILHGDSVGPEVMRKPRDQKGYANLLYFRDLMETMGATPRVTVRYHREAYVSNCEEPVRITYDRRLCCLFSPDYGPEVWAPESPWHYHNMTATILEIKFTDVFPYWVRQLVRRFNLMRTSMAKYVDCVKLLNRAGVEVAGMQHMAPSVIPVLGSG